MIPFLRELLYPEKCVLCRTVLESGQLDLCPKCRMAVPCVGKIDVHNAFVKSWMAVWEYRSSVRTSLLRFKFHGHRSYAKSYGRLLGMRILEGAQYDILTWVPVSTRRRLHRGYDQTELICKAIGKEIGVIPVKTLKKIRHTVPQSSLPGAEQRKANVLGAYKALCPADLEGKRILLIDDILTTGATAGECARTLLTAGAKEVHCATVAVAKK